MRFNVIEMKIKWECLSERLSENIWRVSIHRSDTSRGSALDRYGMLDIPSPIEDSNKTGANLIIKSLDDDVEITLRDKTGAVILSGRLRVETSKLLSHLEFDLSGDERLYGFGDSERSSLNRRGKGIRMWIKNVTGYIPIPFLISSKNYGLFVNTTSDHYWDLGKSDPDKLQVTLPENRIDLFIFQGENIKDILGAYTSITGRPALPPKWSFGPWFICREWDRDQDVMNTAFNFRNRNIPCDVLSLEPRWMEKHYDASIDKEWSHDRFWIPPYCKERSFPEVLKRMGYKLGLWLCNDYDLSYEAERRTGNDIHLQSGKPEISGDDDVIKDAHLSETILMDHITKPEESWFEHLKKFVDQGASLFKQDGAYQVLEHPDRRWANGMSDSEMHNLYPMLYIQQMYQGFAEHTNRRPCVFNCAGWAGLQRYAGTWTGDTGGGEKTLIAILNMALSGHSTATCDMDVYYPEGIHYGFLLPWAEMFSWAGFDHPWLQGAEIEKVITDYARLRSWLVPYLYTYAYQAWKTGIPLLRPILMEYQDDEACYDLTGQYFLGRELMVSAYTNSVYLPHGRWADFWTGKIYDGGKIIDYTPPKDRGGALFLRENSILPLGPVCDYVGQKTDAGYELIVFLSPGGEAEFTLYDDDGVTFKFMDGEYTLTKITARHMDNKVKITVDGDLRIDSVRVIGSESADVVIESK